MDKQATDLPSRWGTWMRAQRWSRVTVKTRTELVGRVAREAGTDPEALTIDEIRSYLAEGAFSAASAQTYWVGLNSWFEWLVDEGIREDNPMAKVRKPKQGRKAMSVISTDHVKALLDAPIRSRTRTMVLLGAYQGLRASEIARVRGCDVDLIGGHLAVEGKGGVRALLPLHPLIAAEAKKYGPGWWFPQYVENRQGAAGEPILGGSVTTAVGGAMKRHGIPGTCHSLRHWYATELLRQRVDLRVIQQLMRHATLASTERYLHVDDTARRAGILTLNLSDEDEVVPTLAIERSSTRDVGRLCPDECPGHRLVGKISTDVELLEFDGPSHTAPVVRLMQGDMAVDLPLAQIERLGQLVGKWKSFGENVDRRAR